MKLVEFHDIQESVKGSELASENDEILTIDSQFHRFHIIVVLPKKGATM